MVFDTSSLISVSQTCLINIFGGLKQKLGADFVVPQAVYFEAVQRPISIRRFELNAVRLKRAIDLGWFRVMQVGDKGVFREIDYAANNCFFIKNRPVRLLQKGEIEALALVKELGARALAVDERTTRMILENPQDLEDLMEQRKRAEIELDKGNVSKLQGLFKGLSIVRSVELIAFASELGLLEKELPKGKQSLEAALFAAKYSGCAVSAKEIKLFLRGKK
jgi:predicted nucleic acid-binding protein